MAPRLLRLPVLPIRARILLIVLAASVIPLGMLGLWMTGATIRSGEALLRERLAATLEESATAISQSWTRYRSALLDLGDDPAVRQALLAADALTGQEGRSLPVQGGPSSGTVLQTRFEEQVAALDQAVLTVGILNKYGTTIVEAERWRPASNRLSILGTPWSAELPIHDPATRQIIGNVSALVDLAALGSSRPDPPTSGAVLAAFDRSAGGSLLPLPFEPLYLDSDRFDREGERWLVVRRIMSDPRIELRAAAPLTPFTEPFRRTAARGVWTLLVVATLALGLTTALTGRLTKTLERLASAAEAVSDGNLELRVPEDRPDEIGRVARAFNSMTDSLTHTVAAMADREALATLGEFATSVAHEIRTPLTAVQLDLEEVEERLPPDSPLRTLQMQAIEDLRRLDRIVSGVLQTARSGRIEARTINLMEVADAARSAAQPAHDEKGVTLEVSSTESGPVSLSADPDALQRAMLNLLQNAVQAAPPSGWVRLTVSRTPNAATVSVTDNGPGMTPEVQERVFDPLFSTREGGTGVGLAIVERIVHAHRGRIEIDSEPGRGTTVRMHLPVQSAGSN